MSFGLSMGVLASGLLALAGLLFLLQRLRVRYQPRRVVTTLFWKEALEEARARVFVRRFRHLLAYLLVLVIASLLWLGFGDPTWTEDDDRDWIVLVDGSATMAVGSRMDDALDQLREQVGGLPRDRRRVLLCQGRVRPVLLPGEHGDILEHRLQGVSPEACPSSVERTLRRLIKAREPGRPLSVLICGGVGIREQTLDLLPADVSVFRLGTDPGAAAPGNRGITSLGVTPASSRTWDHVDVLVETRGENNPVALTLDGRPLPVAATVQLQKHGDRNRLLVRDVPARGGIIEATLEGGDPLPLDDRARLRLPERANIRVLLGSGLDPAVGLALQADPGIRIVTGNPDVVVHREGDSESTTTPTLTWVDPASQAEAILLVHEEETSSRDVLLQSFDQLGLEDVDTSELAAQTGRVVSLGARPGPRRNIRAWKTLLSSDYNFVGSRSFPLFVAAAVRWLSGTEGFPAFVAAGEVVRHTSGYSPEIIRDRSGAELRPARAGQVAGEGGHALEASLLDPGTTAPESVPALAAAPSTALPTGFDPLTLIGLAAMLLLLVEWVLYRTGRVP